MATWRRFILKISGQPRWFRSHVSHVVITLVRRITGANGSLRDAIGCIGVGRSVCQQGIAMQPAFIRNNGHDYLTRAQRASASDALCPLPRRSLALIGVEERFLTSPGIFSPLMNKSRPTRALINVNAGMCRARHGRAVSLFVAAERFSSMANGTSFTASSALRALVLSDRFGVKARSYGAEIHIGVGNRIETASAGWYRRGISE